MKPLISNTLFVLLAGATLGAAPRPALEAAAPQTSLANPAAVFTVPTRHYAVLRRGPIQAVVVDNHAVDDAVLPGHRAGYHGVASLTHSNQPRNLFVPSYAGLNFEHIHDGTVQSREVLFEPRQAPMELRVLNERTAELYQPPTPHWGLESCLRYELLEDGVIEMTFECIPRRAAFRNGYIGLFWASYIDQPESRDIHFLGAPDAGPPLASFSARWVRGVTSAHGEQPTHRGWMDRREFVHAPEFPLTLVYNRSGYRFVEPWYFGVCRGMAFAQLFRDEDNVWLSQSPSGGGNGNPAWDFQWFIPKYEVGTRYRLVMRALYRPVTEATNESALRAEVQAAVAPWRNGPFPAAETILRNGKVVAADERFSIHQAVALADGRIVAVGSDADVMRRRGTATEVIDVRGRLVMPGLMDSHVHAADACLTEFDHPIPTMDDIGDVLNYIRGRARVVKEGEWIEVRQVFITRLKEQRYPTRAELDRAAPRHPVIFATGPDASLNSLALALSGIDRDFKVTDGGSGFAEKDPGTGEPTGLLRNCTRYVKVQSVRKRPSIDEKVGRLRALFADYNSVGLTTVCDRDAGVDDIETYEALRRSGRQTVRVRLSHHVESIGPGVEDAIRRVAGHRLFRERDDWLQLIGIKTFLDGGMLTGSAYLREPWGVSRIYGITDPAYRGVLFIPRDKLRSMVRTAAESGLQFTAHSVGDGAVHALLDVYEELGRELPLRRTRPCISHSNFMSPEAVEQAARLGILLDIQPAWLFLDTRTLARQFGDARLRWFQPLRSLFAAGATAGGGSDHMQKIGSLRSINPYNPFLGMATAVSRRAKGYSSRLHPEEALTREQAIRFYTINNARVLGCDDILGSLEPGKLADLIVVDTDLLTCPERRIADARVLKTYVGGKPVHGKLQPADARELMP